MRTLTDTEKGILLSILHDAPCNEMCGVVTINYKHCPGVETGLQARGLLREFDCKYSESTHLEVTETGKWLLGIVEVL